MHQHPKAETPARASGGNAVTDEAVSNTQTTTTKMNTIKIPAPYRIGRNGTGYLTNIRRRKDGSYSATIIATGKAGQPLWRERRTFTAAQVGR